MVHSLDQARTVLAVAQDLGVAVTLLSARGAVGYLGAPWLTAVAALAAAEHPGVEARLVLDCDERPGLALAALRHGATQVCFTGRKSVAEKLAAIAAQSGATLIVRRPEALDLADQRDPDAACRRWLAP